MTTERTCECQNCNWTGPETDVAPYHDFWSRVSPGEIMPVGDCPECGAFCHYQTPEPSLHSNQTGGDMRVWIVNTCIPDRGEAPCIPSVFSDLAAAEAYADKMLKAEWVHNAPLDDEGEPLPYPGDWREANDAIKNDNNEGSWGEWQLTEHTIPLPGGKPAQIATLLQLARDLAKCTTPEQEYNDPEFNHAKEYDSVDEYVADFSDERLTGEYDAFMDFVHSAQQIVATLDTDIMTEAQPVGIAPKIAIRMNYGSIEMMQAEGLPKGLQVYVVDEDTEYCDEDRLTTVRHDMHEFRAVLSRYERTSFEEAPLGLFTALHRAWTDTSEGEE